MAHVCSPANAAVYREHKTCFRRDALVRLAEAWNASHPEAPPIAGLGRGGKSAAALWKEIQRRMMPTCGAGRDQEGCWVDALLGAAATSTTAVALATDPDGPPDAAPRDGAIAAGPGSAAAGAARGAARGDGGALAVLKSVRPRKPREWYKEPYTWLTNFDIEAVMRQYESDAYRFLGVYPIDFAKKSLFGACLFSEICALRLAPMVRGGARYLGLILNLDTHDKSGSHWTSLFVCLDPREACYGAYYYDSVGRPMPDEVAEYVAGLKDQLAELHGADVVAERFKVEANVNRHQHANTECGIFSMAYQIRWLALLKKRPRKVTFADVVNIAITDRDVHKLRDVLYRPSPPGALSGGGAPRRARGAKAGGAGI